MGIFLPAQANLQQKVKQEAIRQFARRKGLQQSKAAAVERNKRAKAEAKARNIATFQSLPQDQQTWLGAVKASLPKAPAKAQPKALAPAPTKSTWTNVGGEKKKAKAQPKAQPKDKKAWVPPDQYIASLKKQVNVLNQRKAKANRDGKTKDAESFQRQINTLWGKMKRAEERLRQSGSRHWNNQHGGLRKEHPLGDYIKSKRK